jgi:DNA polymerase elongation subunit (family B)
MIHIENTPWFVCKKDDTNFCSYIDTDSNYYNAEPLLRHLYPDFDNMSEDEKDSKLEEIALKYQDLITDHYSQMSQNIFNVPQHRFEMKTECIIRSAYFRATRRYAQWITKKEGVVKNELDIKGLEFMKANFPPIFGEFFNSILEKTLKGASQNEIDDLVLKFREYVMSKEVDITILGNPTSVKTLNDYIIKDKGKPVLASMFTAIALKAPAPVKAAIRYNDLLTFWKLDKQHSKIVQGDKIKWIYLKDNPYRIDALAFLDFDIPEKILTLLNQYADKHKSFESILESKLEGFYNDLGWQLNLNPYRNLFFEF